MIYFFRNIKNDEIHKQKGITSHLKVFKELSSHQIMTDLEP